MSRAEAPVVVVDDVLGAATCLALIARIEGLGPEETLVRTSRGPRRDLELRNNTRVWFDDDDLAARIFSALLPALHQLVAAWPALLVGSPVRCERTFRGYRYRPGQRFALHSDSSVDDDDGARSLLTVLVYANDVDAGGATRFAPFSSGAASVEVVPRAGRACVFLHALPHESVAVDVGAKYAVRTNVMFF